MEAAIKVVHEGQTISGATRDHGIPKSTPFDQIIGKVNHSTNPGPRIVRRKKELGSYLKHFAKVGYGKTRRDVLHLFKLPHLRKVCYELTVSRKGGGVDFLERQNDLSLRQGTMEHYFSLQ